MSGDHPEIIIVRHRGGDHEDGHHGGAWKIAFADFMTAMMALFLVMWLISANDKTKAVIARYFNPVQLVDSTPQPRGLEDPKPGSTSVMPKSAGATQDKDKADKAEAKADSKDAEDKAEAKAEAKPASKEAAAKAEAKEAAKEAAKSEASAAAKASQHEADLMKDPYAVLAEIAGKNEAQAAHPAAKATSEGTRGGSGAIGRKGGEAYRDPFEPLPPSADASTAQSSTLTEMLSNPPAQPAQNAPQSQPQPSDAVKPENSPGLPTAAAEAKKDTPLPATAPLATKIEAALKQGAGSAGAQPHLDIQRTGEGTVIDLTDGLNFAMFGSASAEPSARMVALMEKIGRILKDEKGRITIRGFTDNRPFKSDTYDNWRLSAARAHIAHYMLVRGGLDESRIDRIEGYADRQPRNPKDPGSPENRRIEILLRNGTL